MTASGGPAPQPRAGPRCNATTISNHSVIVHNMNLRASSHAIVLPTMRRVYAPRSDASGDLDGGCVSSRR